MPKKKKKKKSAAAAAAAADRPVVGPDYAQLLRGSLFGRDVALLLCGESHEDAVDVTRPGGKFMPNEGWVRTEVPDLAAEMYGRTFGSDGGASIDDRDDDDDDEAVSVKHRVLKRQSKPVAMGKAREWASEQVKDDLLYSVEMGEEIALLWCPASKGDAKGRAYLVSLRFAIEDDVDDGEEEDDEEDDDGKGRGGGKAAKNGGGGKPANKKRRGSSSGSNTHRKKSSSSAVPEVTDLVSAMEGALRSFRSGVKLSDAAKACAASSSSSSAGAACLFEWTDLDPEARALSHRRLIGEDSVPTDEYDALIRKRKAARRKAEGLWTWDDWFTDLKSKCSVPSNASAASSQSQSQVRSGENGGENPPSIHMVLEASIPPWEVELHRPSEEEEGDDGAAAAAALRPTRAAECIRCLSEDSEGSEADLHDPASDGIGSFIDYMYRRFMDEQLQRGGDGAKGKENGNGNIGVRQWLHCVDSRDLGCEHACVASSLHERWLGLLRPEERAALLGEASPSSSDGNGGGAVRAHWKGGRCFPEFCANPEDARLEELRKRGVLKDDDDDPPPKDDGPPRRDDESDFPVTFPSFELFFGQNTDVLYYDPHVKVAYAHFLARCVKSPENWETFFASLFFGGTVVEALSALDLRPNRRPYLHIRSPILKDWNPKTGEYEWSRRNDDEMDVTSPFLPVGCHLKAAGSDPPRTWSSQIYADLSSSGDSGGGGGGGGKGGGPGPSPAEVALSAREWALEEIRRHSLDPKGTDDEHGGGEWFLAYLRAVHRDVYDDIDRSDPSELLRKKYMPGESDGRPRKHRIGDITIPSCVEALETYAERFGGEEEEEECAETDGGAAASSSPPTTLEEWIERDKRASDPSPEVMAKILIDIWMSKLVDFSTALKIAQVVGKEEEGGKVVVVCYMGSLHTRAMAEFYCDRLGFKKKTFVGSLNWDEDQARILQFPSAFCDPAKLF